MATKALRRPSGTAILQVRIELRGTKPKVWRRVLVPQTITLLKLHLVIQAAFGWGHSHLHEFITRMLAPKRGWLRYSCLQRRCRRCSRDVGSR